MDIITYAFLFVICVLLFVLIFRKDPAVTEKELRAELRELSESLTDSVNALGQALQNNQALAAQMQDARLDSFEEKFDARLDAQSDLTEAMQRSVTAQMEQFRRYTASQIDRMEKTLSTDQQQLRTELTERMGEMLSTLRALQRTNEDKLEQMRSSMGESIRLLREDNNRHLDQIRGTVDEKLQTTLEKRISESFRTVSDQLEQVYKGIGEMQTLAGDVGGLKKVLSGVKTRGILGEVQLGAILAEILSPEQYDTNVATIPGSAERVEYAIRLPGREGSVYLPIDSKFPGDRYEQLKNAQDEGDRDKIEAAYRALEQVIRAEARDIRNKYVEVPYTTNFGVMFLPFEGLYAEVVNRGLIEKLQQDYRISIAGPSTMAALLNSLQMGFRTLAIQKRSNEVWEVLGAVKTEFDKFEDTMKKMQGHLLQTSNDLDALMGTRSRAIERKLRSVQRLDEEDTRRLLDE